MSVHYTVTFHMRVGTCGLSCKNRATFIYHGRYLTPCSLVDVFRRLEEFVLCQLNGTPYVNSGRKVSLPPYFSDMFHSRLPSRSLMISQVIRTQIGLTMVLTGIPCEFQETSKVVNSESEHFLREKMTTHSLR